MGTGCTQVKYGCGCAILCDADVGEGIACEEALAPFNSGDGAGMRVIAKEKTPPDKDW